mmetsp:Transcript_4541/g.12334  ORF Transcript_4541/g.12334 Transcript_4541/m.12334 type:complete len:406 (-) Transcript_4541:716-1933(-)
MERCGAVAFVGAGVGCAGRAARKFSAQAERRHCGCRDDERSRWVRGLRRRSTAARGADWEVAAIGLRKRASWRVQTRMGAAGGAALPDDGGGGGGVKRERRSVRNPGAFLNAFYRFTRPHTIRGTILGALAGCIRALMDARLTEIPWRLLPRGVVGVIALLAANAFIVGINQIYDEDIDRVNKPFLPIAAGDLSPRAAWTLILACAVLGTTLVYRFFSPLIFVLYCFGNVLGVLYSVPPFRWKNNPFLAALSISCARGFLLNFGVYHATMAALGLPFQWSPPITFLAFFMMVFATVIALSKDLPDIEGDRKFKVSTFASRMGPTALSNFVTGLLFADYVFAVGFALASPAGALRRPVMVAGHALLAVLLMVERRRLRPHDNESIKEFYKGIWRLFYSEYVLFLCL